MNKVFVRNVINPPMPTKQRAIGTILLSFVENRKTTRFGTKKFIVVHVYHNGVQGLSLVSECACRFLSYSHSLY